MRKYILLTISLLFFAFTLQSDKPMGWFVQSTPVNKTISSIYFLDSLTGFAVTDWSPEFDTAHIFKTTNGGTNWIIKSQGHYSFTAVQFVSSAIGYAAGGYGHGLVFKTINQGENWTIIDPFGSGVNSFQDLKFVNADTGWVCSQSSIGGGVYKTTNGGGSWVKQLNETYRPQKLFFLNKDTGWTCADDTKLYRTNNGGTNWNLQYTFSGINNVFFPTKDSGYAIAGSTSFMKTINGGTNWVSLSNPYDVAFVRSIYFLNAKTGWFGATLNTVFKTTDGLTILKQTAPLIRVNAIQFLDTNVGYGAGIGAMKTNDGGGPVVSIINNSSETISDYKLHQNYPNPFNPSTIINYQLVINSFVGLKVFDLQGKEIKTLVNKKQPAGSYSVEFNGSNLSSSIYFYTLQTEDFHDTKKMILIK